MTTALVAGLAAGYGIAIPVGAVAILIIGTASRPGFRGGAAGGLRPAPRRLEPPPLVDYGYEGAVLLMLPIYPPGHLPAGGTAEFQAIVKRLICSNICVPEQQRVVLALPLQDDPSKNDSRWQALFDHTRDQLPRRMPSGWGATVLSKPGRFILSVKAGTHEKGATFFPLKPLQIKNAAPQPVALDNGRIQLALEKSDELIKPLRFLEGVLVMGDGKAVAIKAPVISPGSSEKSMRERRRSQ